MLHWVSNVSARSTYGCIHLYLLFAIMMAQQQMNAALAMAGHETSSLAFELVLLPSSISKKLLEPFKATKKASGKRLNQIPQPMLGVLTEFLQQLQTDSKMELTAGAKDQRRRASVQLMVI